MMQPIILSIAAVDSSGGAGISQDTRVAYLHGCRLINCVTGITLQTEAGLLAVEPLTPVFFEQMLIHMLGSYPVAAIKIGAICSLNQIDTLCSILSKVGDIPVIYDPVIRPTLGSAFIPASGNVDYLQLLAVVDYLSPNLPELAYLAEMPVGNWIEAIQAAKHLCKVYQLNVLLKGGHSMTKRIKEGLITADNNYFFTKARQDWKYSRGTGCALSTAFACNLAHNLKPEQALKKASLWLSRYYSRSCCLS